MQGNQGRYSNVDYIKKNGKLYYFDPRKIKTIIGNCIMVLCVIGLIVFSVHMVNESISENEKLIKNVREEVFRLQEKAYFEGQHDYMNGDIRIEKNGKCYKWIRSPWDKNNDTEPKKMATFQPKCDE